MSPKASAGLFKIVLLACALATAGCATPVGVKSVSPRDAYAELDASPLTRGVFGDQTKYVLRRYGLQESFSKKPADAIAALHLIARHDERRDILYALAETSYLYAGELGKSSLLEEQGLAPDYFLLSALYAYYFLLDERSDPRPTVFDRRAHTALSLYNFGLMQGLATGEGGALELREGVRKLPPGKLAISLDTRQFPWDLAAFDRLEPTNRYAVRGVSVRNRASGVGVPLIAIQKEGDQARQALPATVFLRVEGPFAALDEGTATASLELYSPAETSTVALNGRQIPLETDTTTPLAYKLEGAEIWKQGVSAFLGREITSIPPGLYLHEPYRPGKIPVVFVHGTASVPVWWTEMFNTLTSDPVIRKKYQFWYFVYRSSAPVVISADELRSALRKRLALLDPGGRDPALQQMVVVGHSQGGLLTKLTAVETGDRLIRALTGKDLDSLEMPEKSKERARRLLYLEPLPFVKRVVFICTPHRGSFRSKWWNRSLLRALVTFPATLASVTTDYYDYLTDDVKRLLGGRKSLLTSATGMSKENPLLQALADIPLAPRVTGHSIIAVKGEGDPTLGNDGVVEYQSAHLAGMESEFLVRGGHSAQLNPLAIDEVRRILVEHLDPKQPQEPQLQRP